MSSLGSEPKVDASVPLPSPLIKKVLNFAPYCSPNEFSPPPLEGFCFVSVGDCLFIFGGSDLEGQEKAELYSFSLKSGWQLVESQEQNSGDKPTARVAASITAYNKKLYLFGGINESQGWLNDFYVFDVDTCLWTRLSSDTQKDGGPTPRDKTSLIASRDKIFLYGGFGPRKVGSEDGTGTSTVTETGGSVGLENTEPRSSADSDDLATLSAAAKQQVAAEFDYFNDFYYFDPSCGQWSHVDVDTSASSPAGAGDNAKDATPPGLAAYTVCALADKLLYFGGKTSLGVRSNVVYCFALGLKKWLPLHVLDDSRWPIGRSFHSSVVISDRYVITFGGRDVDDWERDDLWLLDTNTMQWMLARSEGVGGVSAPCARYGHVLAVLPDADSRLHLVIYGGSAELDPASGVAQDVLTDMYVVPADELVQACAPVFDETAEEKESKHQHHLLHHHRSAPNEENGDKGDGPAEAKIQRCDDCIDL